MRPRRFFCACSGGVAVRVFGERVMRAQQGEESGAVRVARLVDIERVLGTSQ